MRKVTYGAACTLDGFIASTDGGLDWLHFSKDVEAIMRDYWRRVDTILMGRKTWEVAVAQGGGGGGGNSKIRTYVFSRTLTSDPRPGVTLVRDDAAEFVRALKRAEGKDICVMGGGDFARSLFAGGVIDEVGFNMHPVLLGTGIPLFRDPGRQVNLALSECRAIDGGCVYATYTVRA